MLDRAKAGDTAAFGEFYDATSSLVYGLVLTVVRSSSEAEHVTGAVYLEVWQQPDALLTGRLTLLTALLCLTQRRAVESARTSVATARPLRRGPSRRTRLSLPRASRLQARMLSPQQQEILVLSYLGGYTVGQVSSLLSLPTDAVREALTSALLGLAPARPAMLP